MPIRPVGSGAAAEGAAHASAAAASEANALAAANSALTAANAALLSAGVYATTAAGIAATTNGKYFSVPSANANEYLILYENVSGVATERKRYPSNLIADIARRGNYIVQGNVAKATKIGSTFDWSVTWTRMYVFTATGMARKNVQAVTDLTIPDGQCAYIDLNEAQVGGEFVVHVSTIPLTSTSNPAGSYIDDGKLILFTCLNNVLGGLATLPAAVTKDMLDGTMINRTTRPAYQLIGKLTRFTLNGTSVVLTSNDLRLTRGVGSTSLVITGLSAITVPSGQALYVDLDSALVGGKLVAQVTTGGYSSAAGGLAAGNFVDDKKVYLFINDTLGYGGLLSNKQPLASVVGQVWLKQSAAITFDPATRTLSWSASLILPTIGGQGRIILEAGSYTFSNQGNNVAYLDLDVVLTTGTTPVTAVKGGQYYDGANPDRFMGLPNQVPMFYWNSASDFGPCGGFPNATTANFSSGVLAQDDIVLKITDGLIRAFVKGAKTDSTKYIEFNVGHEVKPFDPTGVDAFGNADIWRLKHTYEADVTPGTTSFARARSGLPILNGGEITAAWYEHGAADYIGGYHGDEILSSFVAFLDGVEITPNADATLVGKKLEYVQLSKLYRCNTQVEVGDHMVHVTITHADSGAKVSIVQNVKWSAVLNLDSSMMTMLPIKRLLNDTFGPVITDTAMRYPFAGKEDVSSNGFTQNITIGSLPNSKLWGPTGISASVEVVKRPAISNCGFYVANPVNYNKLYYSVAGTGITSMGGTAYTTSIGESWDVESVIKMTTNL